MRPGGTSGFDPAGPALPPRQYFPAPALAPCTLGPSPQKGFPSSSYQLGGGLYFAPKAFSFAVEGLMRESFCNAARSSAFSMANATLADTDDCPWVTVKMGRWGTRVPHT